MQSYAHEKTTVTPGPGSDGIWTFVFIDMAIFLLMFVTYMIERMGHYSLYSESQRHLNEIFGLANTLILLTSSWLVVEAVRATRENRQQKAASFLLYAFIFGAAFSVDKCIEYYLKIASGITPVTNSFFSYYFFITAVHFLHVLAGMVFIIHYRSKLLTENSTTATLTGLENIGLFWHFVDVVWIFIFPMLYLLGRQ